MAVLAIFTGQITKAQYDQLRKEVHWSMKTPQEACSMPPASTTEATFTSPRLGIAGIPGRICRAATDARISKVGISPPQVEVYPTHNVNAYKSIDKYKV